MSPDFANRVSSLTFRFRSYQYEREINLKSNSYTGLGRPAIAVRCQTRFLRILLRSVFVSVVSLFASMSVFAQSMPTGSYSALRWRLVGPFRAGRALAATGIPGDPYTFYFGSVDGGIWKSTNAGLTWNEVSDSQASPSIGALAIAPSDDSVIYAGTGEADMRSDMTYGDGVYKSTDAGLHWRHIGLEDTRQIGKILVDPHNPDLALVAALGHAYDANSERGVFRTTDGGQTWTKVLYKNPDVGAVDLGWDPADPAVVYATLWQARRPAWSQYPPDQGDGSGIYKSTDEGLTWAEVGETGLPPKPFGRIGISVATNSGGSNVFALVGALKSGSGLYHSTDGGKTWQLTSTDSRIITRMWYFGRVLVDPKNPNTVYIPNRSIMRSTDGGRTFEAIKGSPGGDDYHYLWIDPTDDNRMIVASDQGTVVSLDGGNTWSSWYNQPTAQFYHVITDNHFPYRIYGAQQDAGTVCTSSRSNYGTITFRDWMPIGAGESGYIAPDPLNPDIVYGGDTYGGVFRFNRITGQSQVIAPSLLSDFYTPTPQRRLRFTWTSPLVFDKHDPHSLYLGAQVLLKTDDGGVNWKPISPDLTQAGEKMNGAAVSHAGWGVIYTVATSPVRAGLIWVGSDDGLIHLTKDGGKHWENVTPKGLSAWSKVSLIEASPFEAGEAYAAVDRHRLGDDAPYIYRTTDFGADWTRADNGIPAMSYVHAVRCDLTKKGLLFAGTETGVYVSFDDGNNWQTLRMNLPEVSVRDLTLHDNDLIVATHGRSFWALDDITPLQQLDRKVLDSDVYLFEPQTAVRIRRSVNSDTPLPPEFPQGTNPPSGAVIDFYLKNGTSGPITLDIFDSHGNLVNHFSGDAKAPEPDHPPYFMNAWLPEFKPLTSHAGLNRFVWDLHYAAPPSNSHSYTMEVANLHSAAEPMGPLVLPGEYKVTLTVDGHSYSRQLKVVMDPRVHVRETSLKDQLDLSVAVWNVMSDANVLRTSLDTLKTQLAGLKASGKLTGGLKSSVEKLYDRIGVLSDSLKDGELSGLEEDISNADGEPTSSMTRASEILKRNFYSSERAWSDLKTKSLPEVNRQLENAGLPRLLLVESLGRHLVVSGNKSN
jgi:photosystem II stability/assembly factor-like uncharacterized protein